MKLKKYISAFILVLISLSLIVPVYADTDENEEPELTEEQIQELKGISTEIETEAESAKNAAYTKILQEFNGCLPAGGIVDNARCNEESISSLTGEKKVEFNRLLQALANREIITTLNEPIGTQNIFLKAQVCQTKFLKDRRGILQPVNDIDNVNRNLANVTDLSDDYFRDKELLITRDKCEEFFVERCTPMNSRQTTVSGGNPLPVQVFCERVQVLFATSGSELAKTYVSLIYKWAAGIIGLLSVIVITWNGISISMAGGDSGKVDNAKTNIIQSLVALAVLFLSGILLYTINPNYFTTRDLQDNPAPTEQPNE